MRFSDHFRISRGPEDDWFDPVLEKDTPLYIDPFLVFSDDVGIWAGAHEDLIAFFALVLGLIEQANGNKSSPAWQKAARLATFPEPKEFALGFAMSSPYGAGVGMEFAARMLTALDLVRHRNIDSVEFVEFFGLLIKGMGLGRISDMFCNIVKSRFLRYTQTIAQRHALPTTRVTVRHSSWDPAQARWNDQRFDIPISPFTGEAVLLTPDRFLKDLPTVTASEFWAWAEVNEADALRQDLNFDLSKSLTRTERVELAHRLAASRPDIAMAFLGVVADQTHKPYDVENDPKLLIGWHEVGRTAAAGASVLDVPTTPEDFCAWVGTLWERFRHGVEQTDLWRVLWNDNYTVPRQEKIVQAVAGSMINAHCEAADVDISKEANVGRGPVDFKFSAGWQKRALAEVKLIRSSQFDHGATVQLPQYLKSESIDCGYYICVGFTEHDFTESRLQTVKDACSQYTKLKGRTIKPIFVDARPKKSASKQESPPDEPDVTPINGEAGAVGSQDDPPTPA